MYLKNSSSKSPDFTLSRYFPEGTEYFYGYPADEDSHFFNGVEPEIEELVAARPLLCAGPGVKTICFEATLKPFVWGIMQDLGVMKARKEDILVLPKEITHKIRGKRRNRMLKQALAEISTPGKLVMAQPFLDPRLKDKFAIPPHRIVWLNDKKNMTSYIPWQYTAKNYDEFLDGQCFEDAGAQIPLPCVIKVSSSSSGDGVRICHTEEDVENAKKDFAHLEKIIIVTELINVKRNLGVQFGIPEDKDMPIETIIWHEQMTDKNGSFTGGIIEPNQSTAIFKPIDKVILEKILPEVRRKGWFGIGGFDVLVDEDGRYSIVDPNFRMTGMTVYDLLSKNGEIKSPLLSFTGTFEGTQKEFKKMITPLARVGSPNQKLYLSALTEHDGIFRFNAALLFGKRSEIPRIAKELLSHKINSDVLEKLQG